MTSTPAVLPTPLPHEDMDTYGNGNPPEPTDQPLQPTDDTELTPDAPLPLDNEGDQDMGVQDVPIAEDSVDDVGIGATPLPTPASLPTGQPLQDAPQLPMPTGGTLEPRTVSDAVKVVNAVQTMALSPNFMPDLTNQVVCDHRNVQALVMQFNKFVANCQEQWLLKVGHAICVLMRTHSQAELEVLYPLVASHLANGPELAAKAQQEHVILEQELAAIDSMAPHVVSPDQRPRIMECPYVKAVTKMAADFTLHIQDEELLMLTELAKTVDGNTAATAAAAFDRCKATTSLMPAGMGKEI